MMADGSSGRQLRDVVPGLRHIFSSKGALPKGAFLLTGPSGSCKTMYCLQFLRDGLAEGKSSIYVSLNPLFSEEKFRNLLGVRARIVAPFLTTASGGIEALFQEIRALGRDGTPACIAVDSITHLLHRLPDDKVMEFAARLYDALKKAGAMALVTLTTSAGADESSRDLSDTLGSLFDGTFQLKFEDEGNDLVRSLRLLSLRDAYHAPMWARFQVGEDGRLAFGHDRAEEEAEAEIKCKLCEKPVLGKAAYDNGSPFHPHCLETYMKLSDIYGSSVIYTIPVGVISANFFFIDIVGLSDPSMSVEKQIKKIEVLNLLIAACEAIARTPKDRRLVLPTGDGMAIGFLVNPELPLQLSMQLHRKLAAFNKNVPRDEVIGVRIGLSTGPVFVVGDLNNNQNVWGPGIIMARRVMDIGDDRHILIADNLAEVLINLKDEYRAMIKLVSHEFRIKHGQAIRVYSASSNDFGNSAMPARLEH